MTTSLNNYLKEFKDNVLIRFCVGYCSYDSDQDEFQARVKQSIERCEQEVLVPNIHDPHSVKYVCTLYYMWGPGVNSGNRPFSYNVNALSAGTSPLPGGFASNGS